MNAENNLDIKPKENNYKNILLKIKNLKKQIEEIKSKYRINENRFINIKIKIYSLESENHILKQKIKNNYNFIKFLIVIIIISYYLN